MALRIGREPLEAVRRHGEAAYPHECCGLLLGPAWGGGGAPRAVAEAHPMRNANQSSPRTRFDLDPQEHLQAQREARARGLAVLGFYHSHPDHPARPSQYDLDHAAWSGYSYVIVAVASGRAADLNSFELAEDRSRFLQESVEVTPA